MNRKYSTLVARISVFMLFLICCSSSILASDTQEYKMPRHSMSYFLQQNADSDESTQIVVEPAPEVVRDITMSWQKPEPHRHEQVTTDIDSNDYSEDVDLVALADHAQEQSETISDAPFAETLRKMQQRSAQRSAEAAQMGITLPSQSGDIAAVSPSLNRLNQAINNIIHRA